MLDLSAGFWVIVGLCVLTFLLLMSFLANLIAKQGERGHCRLRHGRRARCKRACQLIWPMVQNWRLLSLELMSFDVAPQQDLYTKQGVAVTVEPWRKSK